MRKLSIIGGLLLTLAAATSAMAASPAVTQVGSFSPAVTTTPATLTWKATFAKLKIAGTADVTALSTYASDKVVVSATGIKKGASVTLKLFDKVGTKFHMIGVTTIVAKLNAKGQLAATWTLTAAQRAAFKAAERASDPVYFRVIDGSTIATGLLKKA